jgi:hypothetical protein
LSDEDRQAIDDRQELIERRARALAEEAVACGAPWTVRLGRMPEQQVERQRWLEAASTVAAYRDRYGVASGLPVGGGATSDAQQADRFRALGAVREAVAASARSRCSAPAASSPSAVPTL